MCRDGIHSHTGAWYETGRDNSKGHQNIKTMYSTMQNNIEASALGQFSKKARIIAPGIIALDLGVRAYDVNNIREQGGDWERAALPVYNISYQSN